MLRVFHARHPNIELAVQEELSDRLVDRLRTDEVDLAVIASTGDDQARGLTTDTLAVEPLVALFAANDPLAASREVQLEQLAGRPLVVGPAGASIRRVIEQTAAGTGLTMRFAFESNVNARMIQLVADGLASTVLPLSDVPTDDAGVSAVALADPALVHRVLLARRTRRRLSPPASALARLILERYPPLGPTDGT